MNYTQQVENIVPFPARILSFTINTDEGPKGGTIDPLIVTDSEDQERISVVCRPLPPSLVYHIDRLTVREIEFLYEQSRLIWNLTFNPQSHKGVLTQYIRDLLHGFASDVQFRAHKDVFGLGYDDTSVPEFVYTLPLDDEWSTRFFYGKEGATNSSWFEHVEEIGRLEHEIAADHLSFFHADLELIERELSQ